MNLAKQLDLREATYMKERWPGLIKKDPFYNPNLSLKEGYKIDIQCGSEWPWSSN